MELSLPIGSRLRHRGNARGSPNHHLAAAQALKDAMEHNAASSVAIATITTLGAFIGALISHFLIQRRSVDLAVHRSRGEVYKSVWEKTGLLSRWPRRSGLTYGELRTLSEELRNWYFLVGGLYVSDSARAACGNLQEALNDPHRSQSADIVSDSDYAPLQISCSKLRSELTHDLLSRKRMFLFSR
jgi:hypothetical protein